MLIADRIIRPYHPLNAVNIALLAGAVALAAEPAIWLVGTWYRDGYDGIGWLAFVLVLGCAAWSGASPRLQRRVAPAHIYYLVLATALIRLSAQLLDINVLGALLLAVDVFALARIAGLDARARAISPLWLAFLFCFSLPVEPIVQRLIGYDLQRLSAAMACGLLDPWFVDLGCDGVRLSIDGVDVLVDLPCSGAELLSLTGLSFAVLCTLRPPGPWAIAGACACLLLALCGNAVRVTLLALGIAYEHALPFHVMDPVPHTLLGMLVVMTVSAALIVMSAWYPAPRLAAASRIFGAPATKPRIPKPLAFIFLPLALSIGAIQPQPVDASPIVPPPEPPRVAAGFLRADDALSGQEQAYFGRYGGGARRASYGPFGLLLVSTGSPLRHLHDPTICLSGMGFDVQLIGTDFGQGATVYRAVHESATSGAGYYVYTSFLSSDGQLAMSVSEVVWHWLRDPGPTWTMVQRIEPVAGVDPLVVNEWRWAIRRAFNLTGS